MSSEDIWRKAIVGGKVQALRQGVLGLCWAGREAIAAGGERLRYGEGGEGLGAGSQRALSCGQDVGFYSE